MPASDLASLPAVKTWLGISGTASDAQLAALITSISRSIFASLSRPSILPATFTEVFNARPSTRYVLRNFPVISVSSVEVGLETIIAAPSSVAYGWVLDTTDPTPPGLMSGVSIRWGHYHHGVQNVAISYSAGYQVSAEAWTVPATPYQVTVNQPFGAWASDQGVTYANGTALTKVASSPAQGQYSVSLGTYTFAAADVGASVLISYGYVPADLAQACSEWVGQRFKSASFIGFKTKSLGGQETITFDTGAMPSSVSTMIQPYKRVALC